VVARLHEYRAILQASREAMPMHEVPAGLLGAVLQEARASAAKPREAAPPKKSWWRRFRATLILPAAALAGTAALLLIIAYPKGEDASVLEGAPATARSEPQADAAAAQEAPVELGRETQRLADAYKQDQAAGEFDRDAVRGKGMPGTVLEDADDAEVQQELRAEQKVPARDDGLLGGRTQADEKTKSSSRPRAAKPKPAAPSKKETPSDPFAEPEPDPVEPEPAPKTGANKAPSGGGAGPQADGDDASALRTAVDRGDAHRRAGKCGLARLQYQKAQDAAAPELRARALAGLGLCEHAEGRTTAADAWFAKAKSADPSIRTFIDTELAKARK
jgi:hypothetical protein